MKLPLINSKDAQNAKQILEEFYLDEFIPAEKKTYLSQLEKCIGPYLAVKSGEGQKQDDVHYLLDAASQIATLGLGFNPISFFGTAHFKNSWNNQIDSETFFLRQKFNAFLQRKLTEHPQHIFKELQWDLRLCHSGAEANELALGMSYEKRVHSKAHKVLAFKGSFHGRMMTTLMATWNQSKRLPFEWKDYLTEYVEYPETKCSDINRPISDAWRIFWSQSFLKNFPIGDLNPFHNSSELDQFIKNLIQEKFRDIYDLDLEKEVVALLQVRQKILTNQIFSILIEPMQCEGGDAYATDRFHTALILMSKSAQVSIIYDEVQTGFHLGRQFFWHRQFNLFDQDQNPLWPDYVTCAKKAQVGMVLFPRSNHEHKDSCLFGLEEFSVASLMRGYTHALMLGQETENILKLEKMAHQYCLELCEKFPAHLENPRGLGMCFAFDLKDASKLNAFVDARFKFGLLYYPAGNQTLRFRLNTAFKASDFEFLFQSLEQIIREVLLNEPQTPPVFVDRKLAKNAHTHLYEWQQMLLEQKRKTLTSKTKSSSEETFNLLQDKFRNQHQVDLIEIKAQNFLQFRQAIIELEKEVYEPSRQTDIEKFEHSILHPHSIALGLLQKNELIGIAFCGPLKIYPLERGVRNDIHFNDEKCLYMLDLTIKNNFSKKGLGQSLKYALTMMALSKGMTNIQGRNRDQLAANMLNINLSLGSIEQNYYQEDYLDFEKFRDVYYYTTNLQWKQKLNSLKSAINSPVSLQTLTRESMQELLPFLINKMCLSNFVSEIFLRKLKNFSQILSPDLRHFFTCSGQSEAVDKVIKSIWANGPAEKKSDRPKIISFKGHYFGNGSNLARSLSGIGDPYFNVQLFDHPDRDLKNENQVLEQIKNELEKNSILAIMIEPMLQKSMQKVSIEFLKALKKLAQSYKTPLVFNETGAQFYRYSEDYFVPSQNPELTPDAGILYASGQAGLVYIRNQYFYSAPLMMISTWDGDEFSFLSYFNQVEYFEKNKIQCLKTYQTFHQKILQELSTYSDFHGNIDRGFGHFKASIPQHIAKLFHRCKLNNGEQNFILSPSLDECHEYLKGAIHES